MIFIIFFSYSIDKTESPWTNSRYSQCLNCFSYLLPAVYTFLNPPCLPGVWLESERWFWWSSWVSHLTLSPLSLAREWAMVLMVFMGKSPPLASFFSSRVKSLGYSRRNRSKSNKTRSTFTSWRKEGKEGKEGRKEERKKGRKEGRKEKRKEGKDNGQYPGGHPQGVRLHRRYPGGVRIPSTSPSSSRPSKTTGWSTIRRSAF